MHGRSLLREAGSTGPELRRIDPKDRKEALHGAKQAPFDGLELVGVSLVLALVTALMK
jgi:hypothetical protein